MKLFRTLFNRVSQASGERPQSGVNEPATTSAPDGGPVCLNDEDGDDNPRTMHNSSLLSGDSFRDESIPWQLC